MFLLLRVLRKRQRAVAQRSPLKKRDSYNFSCRHCFPDFSRAELTTFGRVVAIQLTDAGVPFVQRREAAGRSDSLFSTVGLPSVLHRSCESDL